MLFIVIDYPFIFSDANRFGIVLKRFCISSNLLLDLLYLQLATFILKGYARMTIQLFSEQEQKDFICLINALDEAEAPCKSFPEAWFPEEDTDTLDLRTFAKRVCSECPAVKECAEFGLKYAEDGIYGGLTASERRTMRNGANSRRTTCGRLGCRSSRYLQGLCVKHHQELADISRRAEELFTTRQTSDAQRS